ncbi:MAG: acylphosphatase [Nanoarchaeota archaeon]
MTEKKRVKIVVSGVVQGVFFRENARLKANELGVFGYIRNLEGGRVEGVFEGDERNVDYLVKYCQKGPKLANVEKIEVTEERYKKEFKDFRVLR